jgi:hypothetical protein
LFLALWKEKGGDAVVLVCGFVEIHLKEKRAGESITYSWSQWRKGGEVGILRD